MAGNSNRSAVVYQTARGRDSRRLPTPMPHTISLLLNFSHSPLQSSTPSFFTVSVLASVLFLILTP
ncbi:MAG: hypothetical protein ACM3O8_08135 [Methylococcaceae bacterium]